MHSFAQTNIQLSNQLRREGYGLGEITTVAAAYELAMRLFTGLFRASGKTFIAHLVGTASILGALRASASVVAAGLLHSAYSAGDFGDGKKGITNARREWMRSRVGKEIEEYVSRYTALKWTAEAVPVIYEGIESLGSLDREVLLVRLANELEEFLDLGILYCGEEKRRHAHYGEDVGKLIVRMAEKLRHPKLGAELERAFAEAAQAEIPSALRRPNAQNISFLLAPPSYQKVMDAVAKRFVAAEKRQ